MRPDLFSLHARLEESHWWFCGRRRILEELVRHTVAPGRGRVVVDVGCGTGANIAALADAYECVGVDTAPEAITLARQRFPRVCFVLGTAPADVSAALARAALVMFCDVLEHVPDDRALLAGVLAAMPAGAQVLITVPASPSLWSEHDVSFGHYRRYEPARLRAAWAGLPVTVRLLSHFNARLFPIVRAVRALSRVRGAASGDAGTDLSLPPAPLNRALTTIFGGEAERLLDCLERRRPPYRAGVSLLALLRREPGDVEVGGAQAGLAPDVYHPGTRITA